VTQVCLVGADDVDLRYELLSRETARAALATYDLHEPFANTVAVDTVSLGAAVSLLNDLNWYLVRFADFALVREPSISTDEWLSRDLAERVRDGDLPPSATGRYLRVHGLDDGELVEPMYATRVDGAVPTYDLRDADETLVVRVADDEFG
jgi:DNA-binding transcriptional ArsR family regulator